MIKVLINFEKIFGCFGNEEKITFYTDKSIYNLACPRKIFHTTVIQVCPNATVKHRVRTISVGLSSFFKNTKKNFMRLILLNMSLPNP